MKQEDSLEPLRELGNNYFKKGLFKEEEKEMHYSKKLAIGRKRTGATYYIDLTEACRIVMIGMTRSGKTWLLREMADRLNQIGYSILFLPDVKNEFFSSRKPVQEKFRKFLLEGEKPQAMKVVTLRPTFFKTIDRVDNPPKGNLWYSINPGMMSKADMNTLMNTASMTPPQQIIMEIILERLEREVSKAGSFSFDDIDRIIDEITEINGTQKTAMKFKFRPLKTSHFYEKEYERSIVKIIKNGYIPAINMESFDQFGKGSFLYPEVTVGIILRTVIAARRKKLIPEIFIMVDEASRFIPVDADPSCKREFLESADLDTRYGVNYAYATQDITKLPESLVKQSRYIFIPYSADVGTIHHCLKMCGMLTNMQRGTNESIYLKNKLKKHEWVVIDKVNSTKEIITPLAPLSWHMETGE